MQVSGEVTKSNIITTVLSLCGGAVVMVSLGLAYGTLRSDEGNDQSRITALELRLGLRDNTDISTEHRLSNIEGDVKFIREIIERNDKPRIEDGKH